MRQPRLFNLDTVMVDVVMMIEHLPAHGGDIRASHHVLTTGGGYNVMSAASRQGMDVTYVGRFGRGALSEMSRADLEVDHIDTPVPDVGDVDVGFCVVLVDATGERTFVTAPGAELRLGAEDLAHVRPAPGDYVFISGYCVVHPETGPAIVAWVGQLSSEVVVAFDPAPRVLDIPSELLDPVLARTDWLLLNAAEAIALSGEEETSDVLEVLLTVSGRRGVVVHAGERGCVIATRQGDVHEVSGYVVDVRDSNGAGDTHDGVFLAELARGTSPVGAATRANAASAIAVSRIGPATCPAREEINDFLATTPSRTH
jgi:sugar/nucleoside kinase (ribokinase family)